jgi:ubiquinone/menaquinone biosynthesis C-methylase UbiE
MLAIARGRADAVPANVELVHADGANLPFHDGEFDAVLCAFVLCSCADPSALLAEIIRVCRPEGKIGLFDFHKARTNQALLGDQFLLHETLKRGIISDGRPVAVCDTFYELEKHLPEDKVKIIFDEHLEGSIAQAFRATTLTRLS